MEYLLEMTNLVKSPQIAIIDYGLGNLHSIKKICDEVGLSSIISSDKRIIREAKALILPGVGSFPVAMKNLEQLDLIGVIVEHFKLGKYIWGICLGFQLLFESSNEFENTRGLSLLKGHVINIDSHNNVSKPHIGWNLCNVTTNESFLSSMNGNFYYFNHSFGVLDNNDYCLATTIYDAISFVSAIKVGNIIGTQFHPEKSAQNGVYLFRKFKELLED